VCRSNYKISNFFRYIFAIAFRWDLQYTMVKRITYD